MTSRVRARSRGATGAPDEDEMQEDDFYTTPVLLYSFGGAVASVGAYLFTWPKKANPVSHMIMGMAYEDKTKSAMEGTPVFEIGRWDVITLIAYTFMIGFWIQSLCYAVARFVSWNWPSIKDPHQVAHHIVHMLYQCVVFVSIVTLMFREQFHSEMIWMGFPYELQPYSAKLFILCVMAYNIQATVCNILSQAGEEYPSPPWREVVYNSLTCLLTYIGFLVPFGYVIFLMRSIVDAFKATRMLVDIFHGALPVLHSFYYLQHCGSLIVHVIMLIIGIVTCCLSVTMSNGYKTLLMLSLIMALMLEMVIFIINVVQRPWQQDDDDAAGDRRPRRSRH
jgi:hypothetical protein